MLRLVVCCGLGLLWVVAPAVAKPTVAVTPIGGDPDKEVTEVVIDVVGESAKVIKPKEVVKTIGKLGIAGELDAKDAKRVQKSLDADAIVQGKVKKDGRNRTLKMTVFIKGKKPGVFTVEFKNAKSAKLRDGVREELEKRLAKLDKDDDDDDDEKKQRLAEEKRKREEDEDKKRRIAEDDEKKKKKKRNDEDEDKKKKKRVAVEDDDKKKKKRVAVEDDDGEKKIKKKKKRRDDDDIGDEPRKRTMLRVNAGPHLGVRRLTYKAADKPPRVGTFGASAHLEAEYFPFARKRGAAGGLGLAGEFDKTLGLSIEIPGGAKVPIDQQHFSLGARFRIDIGKGALTLGGDFLKRKYVADRSKLAQPNDLDAPDTNYTALVPNAGVRLAAGSKATIYSQLGVLLILDAGPIQENTSYGAATVYGVELAAGVDIGLTKSLALRLGGELSQVSFKFKGNGALAMARGVTAAADRTFGLATTLGMTY